MCDAIAIFVTSGLGTPLSNGVPEYGEKENFFFLDFMFTLSKNLATIIL